MDPASGIGLAASLITICAVFLNSCQLLSSLKHKMIEAPGDVHIMCQLAEDCSVLLSGLSTTASNLRYTDPEVQDLWQRRKVSMALNVQEFEELVTCLQKSLTCTIFGLSIRSRIKILLSEQKVARFNRILEENKSFLTLMNGIEVRYELNAIRKSQKAACSILTSIRTEDSTHSVALKEEIKDLSARIERLSRSMVFNTNCTQETNTDARLCHSIKAVFASSPPSSHHRTTFPVTKISHHHISMMTPFGTFSVTRFIELEVSDDSKTTPRKYDVFYCFVPESWMAKRTVQLKHSIKIDASRIPYWQRIECGSISSIPPGLTESLHRNDLWSAGHIIQSMGPHALTQLSILWNIQKKPCSVHTGFNNWALHRYGNQFMIRSRQDREAVGVGTIIVRPRNQLVTDSSCHSNSELDMQICILGGTYWPIGTLKHCSKRLFVLTTDIFYFKEADAPPTLCIDPSEVGLQTYQRHIMSSLENTSIEELHVLDRWWLSALSFSNHRFTYEMVLDRRRTFHPRVIPDYKDTVQEVLDSSSRYHRQVFLTWLCAMGTPGLLESFIRAGYNFDEYQGPRIQSLNITRSYAQIAGTFWNIPILQLLAQNGFGLHPTALGICMPGRVECAEDLNLLQSLIDNVSQSLLPLDDTVTFSPVFLLSVWASVQNHDLALMACKKLSLSGLGCYTQPPFALTHYLGPELILAVFLPGTGDVIKTLNILIDLGASLDYRGPPGAEILQTALDWAIDLGYPRQIACLIQRTAKFTDYKTSILHALDKSTRNLEAAHPRPCPLDQRCRFSSWSLEGPSANFRYIHQSGRVTAEADEECVKILRGAALTFREDDLRFSRAFDQATGAIRELQRRDKGKSFEE